LIAASVGTTVHWNLGYQGSSPQPYWLTVGWLKNPSSMPTPVANQLSKLGFTPADYQQILEQDPLATGTAVDTTRYVPTTMTFPYENTVVSSDCNNGVCSCIAFSGITKNETTVQQATGSTVSYSAGWSFKANFGLVSLSFGDTSTTTSTSTTTNTTDSSNTASVTVTCPSPSYTGQTLMAVYWDTIYGTFMFLPITAGHALLLHEGSVVDSSHAPVRGREVTLKLDKTTYRTVTNAAGRYRFYALAPVPKKPSTGQLSVGTKSTRVDLASSPTTVIER
jgi:hypothetical protein